MRINDAIFIGSANLETFSNISSSSASSPHSTPVISIGPAAVSTLQRRGTGGGIGRDTAGSKFGFQTASETGIPLSAQGSHLSNTLTDPSENVCSTNTTIATQNSSKSDSYQGQVVGSVSHPHVPALSSTTSSTAESPKQPKKLKHLIFSGKNLKKLVSKHKETDHVVCNGATNSAVKMFDGGSNSDSANSETASKKNAAALAQAALDDRHRRKFISHHDVASLCASLGGSAQIRAKEALERRNTTTGASAASAALRSGNSEVSSSADSSLDFDNGDNISNELVLR